MRSHPAAHSRAPRNPTTRTMALKRITAPNALPVSLAEIKAHLRVDTSDEDADITAKINAAVEAVEHITGRALMTQSWLLSLDAFPRALELTRVPVASVASIEWDDSAGAPQTLSPSLYALDNADEYDIARVVPAFGKSWPAALAFMNSVRVTFVAGYPDAASVPDSIKSWIKLHVGTAYENRETETIDRGQVLTLGFADRLLDRYRVWKL